MKQNHLQTSLSEDRKEKNDNLHSQHFSSFLPRSGIGTWVRFCLFLFSSRKIISVGRTEAASMLAALKSYGGGRLVSGRLQDRFCLCLPSSLPIFRRAVCYPFKSALLLLSPSIFLRTDTTGVG